MQPLSNYKTIIFDCDGVLLDSNEVKTRAFFDTAIPFGKGAASALVEHHKEHGGVSRWRKFEHFKTNILGGRADCDTDALVSTYAAHVRAALSHCAAADGLQELRAATSEARWLVVSGGDQTELRDVFAERGLTTLFDGGVFGSPDSKDDILARERASGLITNPALFLGDSRYDHEAAARAGLDFIFVSNWSEFADWRAYTETHALPSIAALADLLQPSR